ncbi:disease resistance protein RGA1 [Pyrus ussuriensis x Pyrus communis]|uniref:Disease resistance protein RGA1 n=1 Tax=Pyrus ussuriensis x Pyrus communis TaxID=2448454 RepID=A0A5N5FMF4_9ROSA|nr:disease resistance protein RGA1 [Pyrus ussuriensis x Pyrus communis]
MWQLQGFEDPEKKKEEEKLLVQSLKEVVDNCTEVLTMKKFVKGFKVKFQVFLNSGQQALHVKVSDLEFWFSMALR